MRLPDSRGLSASNSYRFSALSFHTVIRKVLGVLWYCLQAVIEVAWKDEVFMLSKKPLVSVGMICNEALTSAHARISGELCTYVYVVSIDCQYSIMLSDGHLSLNFILAICRFEIHAGAIPRLGLL